MPVSSRAEVSEGFPDVQQEVARLAASAELRSAFAWLRAQEAALERASISEQASRRAIKGVNESEPKALLRP